ncbi:MAG: STAS domain-containing protein [Phycisphaerales bacterium]
MKFSFQDYDFITVITLSGEFTAEDTDQFQRAIKDRQKAGAKDVLVDCENLEFIDSAGLENWLRLQEDLGMNGGQFRLIKPEETIEKILELTRLDLAFESHQTVEEAVKSLRR